MMRVRNLTLAKDIGEISYRNASAVLKQVTSIKVRDVLGLQTYFAPGSGLAVDVPGFASGAAASASIVAIATETIIATPSGGQAPYSFLWELVDDFGTDWTIISPTNAATYFRAEAVSPPDSTSRIFAAPSPTPRQQRHVDQCGGHRRKLREHPMTVLYADNLLDERNGRPIEGAKLWVYDADGNEAVLTDAADQPLAQPLLTDQDGAFEYKAADGVYRHDFWSKSVPIYRDNRVIVGTPGTIDVAVGSFGVTLVGAGTATAARTSLAVTSTADLAASSGSAGVGVIQAGTGAVAETQQTATRREVFAQQFSTVQQAYDAQVAAGNVLNLDKGTIVGP